MYTSTEHIDQDIDRLSRELARLHENRVLLEKMERQLSDEQKLAIAMHDTLCMHNHTDGCGWFYEVDGDGIHTTWAPSSTHGTWHEKAVRLSGFCCQNHLSVETAIGLFKFMKQA
jgi:hypothetical protein